MSSCPCVCDLTVVTSLQVTNLRNLAQVRLTPGPGVNLFFGANGSGKSSVIESLHLLGVGRSFRTQRDRRLIRDGESACTIFSMLHDGTTLGISKSSETDNVIQVNGDRSATRADLAARLPFLLFDPTHLEMLMGPSQPRRQLLDWALFHVEPEFHAVWQQTKRALLQRNSLLKSGKISITELDFWETEFVRLSERLDGFRSRLMLSWQPLFEAVSAALLPDVDLQVMYHRGWDNGWLLDQLRAHRDRDRERGFTQLGPHRADLRAKVAGVLAVERLSRGQQKLAVFALQLAFAEWLCGQGKKPVLLLDDVASELDPAARRRICERIAAMQGQVFMTAIEASSLAYGWHDSPVSWFHVEQGHVTALPHAPPL